MLTIFLWPMEREVLFSVINLALISIRKQLQCLKQQCLMHKRKRKVCCFIAVLYVYNSLSTGVVHLEVFSIGHTEKKSSLWHRHSAITTCKDTDLRGSVWRRRNAAASSLWPLSLRQCRHLLNKCCLHKGPWERGAVTPYLFFRALRSKVRS